LHIGFFLLLMFVYTLLEGAGKFGWGTAENEEDAPAVLDPNDPNYEEEDEEEVETFTL
jgi:hypothetical protein